LAGLIDSDGYQQDNCYEIFQKSKELAEDIEYLALSLGFMATVTQTDKGCMYKGEMRMGDYYRISIFGEGLETIPVLLERKKCHPRNSKRRANCVTFQVEPLGEGDYNGFELDRNGRFLLGDFTVTHNSSILLRFTDDEFQEDLSCTIGVDFKTKTIVIDNTSINLVIWDTAGQEKFRSLTSSYYRGTHGIILAYDVTKRATFDCLENWLNEIQTYSTNPDAVILLVGNKIDKENREVTREEGAKFAKQRNMLFIECSAKTRLGVQQAFEELVQKMIEKPTIKKEEVDQKKVHIGGNQEQEQQASFGCPC